MKQAQQTTKTQGNSKNKGKIIAVVILGLIALICVFLLVFFINKSNGDTKERPTVTDTPMVTLDVTPSQKPKATSTPTVTPTPTVTNTPTPTLTPTPTPVAIIMLDPGHACLKYEGVYDRGTTGYWDDSVHTAVESDLVWDIAEKVRAILEEASFEVLMTRHGEENPGTTVKERRELADATPMDAYVSIHMNSYAGDRTISGIETYFNSKANDNSGKLADFVQEGALVATGAKNRWTRDDRELAVIKTNKPSCLIEVGYLSSETEWEKLTSDNYRTLLAQGIAEGIFNYINWVASNE